MHSDRYIYLLITFMSVVVSVALSLTFAKLDPQYQSNVELDRIKNILQIAGYETDNMDREKIDTVYKTFNEIVIKDDGVEIDSVKYNELSIGNELPSGESVYELNGYRVFPLFEDTKNNILIIPISGKGLWGTLYGYFAINNNGSVAGITFYKHKETPGLGGEVDAKWFQEQFNDTKYIFNNEKLVSLQVMKPGINTDKDRYSVNGISGATITSNGLQNFLKADLENYEHYIRSYLGGNR